MCELTGKLNVPRTNSVDCILFNARSVVNKWQYLLTEMFLHACPKIIVITETWLKPCLPDNLFTLCGYSCARCDRAVRHGGGVMVFVHDSLYPHSVMCDCSTNNDFYNIVMFKLCCSKYKSCNVQVIAVYVVPNCC